MSDINAFWIFRVASNPEVGGGHIMRSISLALKMKKYFHIHFVLDSRAKNWVPYLNKKGFTADLIHSKGDQNFQFEAKCIGVLIDSYEINLNEMREWKNKFHILAVIDDFGGAPSFADFVIAPSLNENTLNSNQILMFGPKYSLLSAEYDQDKFLNPSSKNVKTICLSFGLYDSQNCAQIALNAISKTFFSGVVKIAIGSTAPHINEIKKNRNNFLFDLQINEDLDGLYDFYSKADLIIGSGGLSLLERMALGKTSITLIVADNQINQAQWASEEGATILFNIKQNFIEADLVNVINELLLNITYRNRIGKIAGKILDGKGATRVTEIIVSQVNI